MAQQITPKLKTRYIGRDMDFVSLVLYTNIAWGIKAAVVHTAAIVPIKSAKNAMLIKHLFCSCGFARSHPSKFFSYGWILELLPGIRLFVYIPLLPLERTAL